MKTSKNSNQVMTGEELKRQAETAIKNGMPMTPVAERIIRMPVEWVDGTIPNIVNTFASQVGDKMISLEAIYRGMQFGIIRHTEVPKDIMEKVRAWRVINSRQSEFLGQKESPAS